VDHGSFLGVSERVADEVVRLTVEPARRVDATVGARLIVVVLVDFDAVVGDDDGDVGPVSRTNDGDPVLRSYVTPHRIAI
jgi:hypothetical protein